MPQVTDGMDEISEAVKKLEVGSDSWNLTRNLAGTGFACSRDLSFPRKSTVFLGG